MIGPGSNDPVNILARVQTYIRRKHRSEYVVIRSQLRNHHAFTFQVGRGPDAFAADYVDATNMAASQDSQRRTRLDAQNVSRWKREADIRLALENAVRRPSRSI